MQHRARDQVGAGKAEGQQAAQVAQHSQEDAADGGEGHQHHQPQLDAEEKRRRLALGAAHERAGFFDGLDIVTHDQFAIKRGSQKCKNRRRAAICLALF